MIGNNMLTNSKYIILRSPQKYETKNDKTEIARRKSRVFAIIINKIKLYKVIKNGFGNFFSFFHGIFKDKKYTIEVRNIIKTNNALGNVAGCIPLFKIGGTMSNVNVTINKTEEIIIIKDETLKESVKKKGKRLLFALFLFCTLFI
jgi:hypothetical protein